MCYKPHFIVIIIIIVIIVIIIIVIIIVGYRWCGQVSFTRNMWAKLAIVGADKFHSQETCGLN